MKIKKRHIVLSALVLVLSVAVLLNWQLSVVSMNKEKTGELGVATYVGSSVESSSDEVAVNSLSIKSSPLTDEQVEYFVTSRADRQRALDDAVALAKQVLELAESSDEAKEEAAEQLSKIEDNILSQSRVETTLKGKGFTDCICCLDDTSCTVIVPENEIEETSVLIISNCVADVSGLPFENINVVGA